LHCFNICHLNMLFTLSIDAIKIIIGPAHSLHHRQLMIQRSTSTQPHFGFCHFKASQLLQDSKESLKLYVASCQKYTVYSPWDLLKTL
jgi:hypothetical protein